MLGYVPEGYVRVFISVNRGSGDEVLLYLAQTEDGVYWEPVE